MVKNEQFEHEPHVISERQKGTMRRTVVPSPQAVVEGWAFGVAMPAFAAALDVLHSPYLFTQVLSDGRKRTVERMLWTRGTELAFDVGDTFHAPSFSPGCWAEQQKYLTHSVQVKARHGERLELLVRWWKVKITEKRNVTQWELAELLRVGVREDEE